VNVLDAYAAAVVDGLVPAGKCEPVET